MIFRALSIAEVDPKRLAEASLALIKEHRNKLMGRYDVDDNGDITRGRACVFTKQLPFSEIFFFGIHSKHCSGVERYNCPFSQQNYRNQNLF